MRPRASTSPGPASPPRSSRTCSRAGPKPSRRWPRAAAASSPRRSMRRIASDAASPRRCTTKRSRTCSPLGRSLRRPNGGTGDVPLVRAGLDRTIKQLRDAVFDLHPYVLEHAGLRAGARGGRRAIRAPEAGFASRSMSIPSAAGHRRSAALLRRTGADHERGEARDARAAHRLGAPERRGDRARSGRRRPRVRGAAARRSDPLRTHRPGLVRRAGRGTRRRLRNHEQPRSRHPRPHRSAASHRLRRASDRRSEATSTSRPFVRGTARREATIPADWPS